MTQKITRLAIVSFMLLLFLFSNFMSFVMYGISECQNKRGIQSMLKKGDMQGLIMLPISFKQLHNKNIFQGDDDEITYKGHLYDVAKAEVNKDGVVFYCINDKEEEALNSELNDQVKTLFDEPFSGKTSAKALAKNMTHDYIAIAPFDLNLIHSTDPFSFHTYMQPKYNSAFADIFIPPPLSV